MSRVLIIGGPDGISLLGIAAIRDIECVIVQDTEEPAERMAKLLQEEAARCRDVTEYLITNSTQDYFPEVKKAKRNDNQPFYRGLKKYRKP